MNVSLYRKLRPTYAMYFVSPAGGRDISALFPVKWAIQVHIFACR